MIYQMKSSINFLMTVDFENMNTYLRRKLLKLFVDSNESNSDLPKEILAIANSSSNECYENTPGDGEISIDLIELIGLIEPDYVEPNLDISEVFIDSTEG